MDQSEISPWDKLDQTFDEKFDEKIEFQEEQQNQQKQQIFVPKKQKKKKYLKVNTTKARSELKLIRQLIYRNGWKECNHYDEGELFWSGLSLKDDDIMMCLKMKTNRFPGMRDLATKTQTGFYLNKFREYFPEDFDFYPRSYLLPEQYDEFKKAFKNSENMFLAKPDAGSQGDGIFFIKTLKDLQNVNKEIIVQEYISNPLLIDNKKFDLRMYVLITSIDPFIAYLNTEGLARFCTEDYQKPNSKNISNYYMHLTNYSLQKESPNFIHYTDNFLEINNGTKRTISSIKKNLQQQGFDVSQIFQDIEDMIVQFLISLHPFLVYNFKAAFQNQASKAQCFHILGCDILIDQNGKPWMLEINANPSLNIEHEILGKDGKPIIEQSPLDEFVKTLVMEDCIYLVQLNPQKQLEQAQEYYSYKMIIQGESESDEKELIDKMLKIYGYLSGFKFCERLTSSKFCKLANLQGMTNEKFIKTDYDLLFRKILLGQFVQQMDFFHFIEAIEKISEKLCSGLYDAKNKYPAVSSLVNRIVQQLN